MTELSRRAVLVGSTVVSAEVLLRVLGYSGYREPARAEADGWLRADPQLGFSLAPGDFEIAFGAGERFAARHDSLGRLHGPRERAAVHLFGCSLVYGFGVAAQHTVAARLAERVGPVLNLGVPAFGLMQMLLLQRSGRLPPPEVVLVGYAAFHDERTALLRHWQRSLHAGGALGDVQVPYTRTLHGEPEVAWGRLRFEPWSLSRRSALVDRVDRAVDRLQSHVCHEDQVARNVLLRMHDEALQAGASFAVVRLDHGWQSDTTIDLLQRDGVPVIDAGLDLTDPRWCLSHDPHPNAAAHAHYADAIAAHWNEGWTLPPPSPGEPTGCARWR